MTVREIRGHLEELYGIDESPDLISTVTDAVLETVTDAGPTARRLLSSCLRRDPREDPRRRLCRNRAVYIALGILPDEPRKSSASGLSRPRGRVLAAGHERTEKPGCRRHPDRRRRWLKGFPDAINAVFPETVVQTCIVRLIRNSMGFASWKDRKAIASALKSVYRADNAEAGLAALEALEESAWARDTRPSRRAGAGTGSRSSRTTRSVFRSAGLSTLRMP